MGKVKYKSLNEYIYIATVLIAVFFMISKFMYFNVLVLSSFFVFILLRQKGKIRAPKIIIILIAFSLLIALQMIISPSVFFSMSVAVQEVIRMYVYILVILIIANTAIREDRFLKLWNIIFLGIGLIAIFQYFKAFGVNDALGNIYGVTIHLRTSMNHSNLDFFRAGSVFLNSNSLAKFTLLYLSIFLTFVLNKNTNKMLIFGLITLLITTFTLAGSRTGILIVSIILFLNFLSYTMKTNFKVKLHNILITILFVFIGLFALIYISEKGIINFDDLRMFNIIMGFETSFAYKLISFTNMLNYFNVLNLLIGMGPFENAEKYLTLVDFDIGYLITYFGVLGLTFYFFMIGYFYNYKKRLSIRHFKLNRLLVIIFILFGFTGGVFFNLRFFTIFCTIVYANINEYGGGTDEINN